MNTPVYFFAESQLHYVWSRAQIEGKTILIILMVFSIFAWWVMAFKALQMSRAKKLNLFFDAEFRAQKQVLGIFDRRLAVEGCPMFTVYHEGSMEIDARLKDPATEGRKKYIRSNPWSM